MPIEQNETYPPPDSHAPEMAQMHILWQTLPDEHKVALALQFVGTIMEHEYRPYFLHLMAQRWPLRTTELESAYPTIEISEEDLMRANLDEEEIAQLTAEHRQRIGEIMCSHYIHDVFWPELRYVAQTLLSDSIQRK